MSISANLLTRIKKVHSEVSESIKDDPKKVIIESDDNDSDESEFEDVETVASAIENILDNSEEFPDEISEWAEGKLSAWDSEGELSVSEVIMTLDLEQAVEFYDELTLKLTNAGVEYNEES